MKSPFTEGEVLLKHEKRTHTYRNQEFTINAQYYQCVDTGETFTTDEIDSLNLTPVA